MLMTIFSFLARHLDANSSFMFASYQYCRNAMIGEIIHRICMRVLVLALAVSLSACGFHWRGADMSASTGHSARDDNSSAAAGVSIYVQTGARFSELEVRVQDVLRDAGLDSAETAAQAQWVLDIRDDKLTRRAQTVDSNGRPADYELIYSVSYAIATEAQLNSAESYRISARREYSFDAADLLGKASEEALLITEMRVEIAQRLVQQVRYRAATQAASQAVLVQP